MARSGCYEVVFAIETRKVALDWSLEDESYINPLFRRYGDHPAQSWLCLRLEYSMNNEGLEY